MGGSELFGGGGGGGGNPAMDWHLIPEDRGNNPVAL